MNKPTRILTEPIQINLNGHRRLLFETDVGALTTAEILQRTGMKIQKFYHRGRTGKGYTADDFFEDRKVGARQGNTNRQKRKSSKGTKSATPGAILDPMDDPYTPYSFRVEMTYRERKKEELNRRIKKRDAEYRHALRASLRLCYLP
jgi:hypothetical protein